MEAAGGSFAWGTHKAIINPNRALVHAPRGKSRDGHAHGHGSQGHGDKCAAINATPLII